MLILLGQNLSRYLIILILVLVLLSTSGTTIHALPAGEDVKQIPWHISALVVTYDNKKSLYIAEDNVVITGGKTRLEADYVEFSNVTKDAFAQGNVLLISGEDSISCNAMNINLETQTGTVNEGTIFIQKNNMYIRGQNIRKTGEFTYDAEKGSITSCTGDTPDWKITGKKVKVTIEGYGTARNTILWAKKMPVFYSPYLVFPVKTKRQTGLLLPRVSPSSDRKGFEYEQPLFIALSRNTDATVYVDYMEKRGVKTALEFRYILDSKSKGAVMFDYLEDDKKDDGTEATELYSFTTTPQRTNTDRFWLRLKQNQDLPDGFSAKLDIDVVSDADYLQEFKDGFTGYDATQDYFEKEFDRSLDEYDDTVRKNWFNLNKNWSVYTFNLDAYWYDDVVARRENSEDTTLQTLPAIQFDSARNRIWKSPIYFSLDSEFRSFYRKDTTSTLVKGQRTDMYPKLFYPTKFLKVLNFEPYLGLRHTTWHTTDFTDTNGNADDFRTREMYDTGAELSTKVIRIFSPENAFADKLKHEIIPALDWNFIPYISQDEFPYFDGIDRIEEQNLLTFSITQNFITRKTRIPEKGESKTDTLRHDASEPLKPETVYREIAWIKLSEGYDIKKERDNESKPFTDLRLESELRPHDFFSVDTDTTWSPYDSHFKIINIGSTLRDNRGDSLRTEYRYTTTLSETLYSRINIAFTDELKGFYSFEKNLKDQKTIETQAGLTIEKACWTLHLFFSDSSADKSFAFLVNLHGIGEFGTK